MLLKMAFLSLYSHRRRTALVVFAVAISALVMQVMGGMLEGLRVGFFENTLGNEGHLQIHAGDWEERLHPYDIAYRIEAPEPYLAALRSEPAVTQAEPIVHFGAMAIHGERNLTIGGIGIPRDTLFFEKVGDGLTAGRFFSDETEVLVGRPIAELLELEVNDSLVLLVQDSTGAPYYLEFAVAGVFATDSNQFDENTLVVSLAAAQELLYLDEAVTEIRVALDDPDEAEDLAQTLSASFQSLDIRTWREVHGSYIILFELVDLFAVVINLFVVVIAATVITNAILMNVFEKTQEYGTLRAIGLKVRGQTALILAEGIFQGLLGSFVGVLLAVPVVLYFQNHGIEFGEVTESMGLGSVVTFRYTILQSITSLVFGTLVAVAGSTYAAHVGARRSITDSLRAG